MVAPATPGAKRIVFAHCQYKSHSLGGSQTPGVVFRCTAVGAGGGAGCREAPFRVFHRLSVGMYRRSSAARRSAKGSSFIYYPPHGESHQPGPDSLSLALIGSLMWPDSVVPRRFGSRASGCMDVRPVSLSGPSSAEPIGAHSLDPSNTIPLSNLVRSPN
jgi:hypothetical protein